MNFIKIIKNNTLPLLRFFCHSRENGNPESANNNLDFRLRGNDRGDANTCKSSVFRNLQPTTYNLQPSRGFTLIETLVAISILMIAVASPLTIAQKGLASAIYAKDQIIASYLAQDAIEYLRNVSDRNVVLVPPADWLTGVSGGVDIKNPCVSSCKVDTSASSITSITSCSGSSCTLKYDSSSHIYNYTSADDSPFTRSVIVTETVPGVEALVKVNISWTAKNTPRSLDFYTRIYNWR